MSYPQIKNAQRIDEQGSQKLNRFFDAFKVALEAAPKRADVDYWQVHDVLRTAEEQAIIHARGAGVEEGASWHQPNKSEGKSDAFDIYAIKDGRIVDTPVVYDQAEDAAKAATKATGIRHAWSGYFRTGVKHYSHFSVEQSTYETLTQFIGKYLGIRGIFGIAVVLGALGWLFFRRKK